MKTLYIISKGIGKMSDEEIHRREKENNHPRVSLLENALSAEVLDERYLTNKVPAFRRWIYQFISVGLAQMLEALSVHQKYDVIFTQSERVGLPLAFLMQWLGIKKPHVMVISRITSRDKKKGKLKKWFMKNAHEGVSKFLIWSSNQYKIAVNELGIPESKVERINRGTDQRFWHPIPSQTDTITSVGMEMRDYPTLVEALRPLNIPCHFAVGASRGQIFDTVKKLYAIDEIPKNITIGRKQYIELRKLYARSRFVVISLLPTDSDNGNTAILEAMAMGKPVICSRVEGQIDVIEEGKTGIFVPQGDPAAMRKAIKELWDNPQKAEEMGRAARNHVEKHHNIEDFTAKIQEVVYNAANDSTDVKELALNG